MEFNNITENTIFDEFTNIKETVKSIIKNKDEVTPITKIKKSGIYMIYIDNFNDDKIIPIYVGQSIDIQSRYKKHYCEILSLNRLSYEEYKKYNDLGIYDGSFKSCKIYKYMIEHNCDLSHYHLIVLEYCLENELEQKEQYYMQKFKSEYFGFNQLNLKTLFPAYIHFNKANDLNLYRKYIEAFKENCNCIVKYFNWGFTKFNYEYAFPTDEVFAPFANEECKKMLDELIDHIDYVNNYIDSPTYKKKMDSYNIEDTKEFLISKNKINKDIRQILLPSIKYDKYPLKNKPFPNNELEMNSIRFIISNNSKYKISDIIKIEYNLNGIYKEFFIENETTINSSSIEYGEKDLYYKTSMAFGYNFFNIIPKNFIFYHGRMPKIKNDTKTSRFISVLSEYKTGINDFTIYDKTLISLDEAMLNVIEHIDSDTKIKVISSEPKTLLSDLLTRDLSIKTQNKIKKKTLIFNI